MESSNKSSNARAPLSGAPDLEAQRLAKSDREPDREASGAAGESALSAPTSSGSGNARAEEPEQGLEIKSLGQGTLEPVAVEKPAGPTVNEAEAHHDSQQQSDSAAASSSAPSASIEVSSPVAGTPSINASEVTRTVASRSAAGSPAFAQRIVIMGAVGALVLMGVLIIALRSSYRAARGRTTAVTPKVELQGPAKPGVAGESQVAQKVGEKTDDVLPPSAPEGASIPNAASSAGAAASVNEAANHAESAAGVEDTVRVAIRIRPEGARVFYRGKEIGRTPFTLELLRDERRVFEVSYPGYQSKRLVIDGTEGEINYALVLNH